MNGTEVQATVNFPATTTWTTWTEVSVSRTFAAGQQTIRLESTTANGLANIDYLQVSGTATGLGCSGVARIATTPAAAERLTTPEKIVTAVYPNPAGAFSRCRRRAGSITRW